MELGKRIADWSRWAGWRRYAPAAGSVVAHVFIGMGVFVMLAATSKPLPMGVRIPPPRQLEVTLVAETPPPRGIRPTPPDAPKAPPRSDPKSVPLPSAPPVKRDPNKDRKQQQAAAQPKIAGGAQPDEAGGVYLGDASTAQSGAPLGLRSLLEADPCKPKQGLPRGDCGASWKDKLAQGKLLEKPSAVQLRAMYPGIVLPCRWKVGCDGPVDGKLNNGTRSVFSPRGNPMMSGAGGLGGINELTGRLGFNPDHTDPGFGD